jgi:hypothetical protein
LDRDCQFCEFADQKDSLGEAMKYLTSTLTLICLVLVATATISRGDDQPADLTVAQRAELGKFVVGQHDAGLRGEALAKAIQAKLAEIKKVKGTKNASKADGTGEGKGPGEALDHGLNRDDMTNLGKFVNEKLADGLRGQDLAAAIHDEIQTRKTERAKQAKAGADNAARGEGKSDAGDDGKGPGNSSDRGAGRGNGGGQAKGGGHSRGK